MSLKCMIDKWLHKGQISQEEYDAVIKKLDGHNKQVRAEAIDELVEFANTMPTVEEEDGEIRPMWLEEMAEQLKEKKNERNDRIRNGRTT